MPTMANITVKKADGTTDIVYSAVTASAGDKSPAVWRANAIGIAPAFRPELRVLAQDNAPRTVRRSSGTYTYPQSVVAEDGTSSIANKAGGDFSFYIPQGMPDADIAEAAAQFCNLIYSSLIKSTLAGGYAPT